MQYTVDRSEKEVKLSITIDKQEWEEAVEQVYQKNKHKYSLPGFRKGKAPRKALEAAYGPSLFFEESFNEVFSKSYSEILIKERDIEPIDRPNVSIDDMGEDGSMTVTATVLVRPPVKLGQYTGLKIEAEKAVVTDDDVDHELYHLREKAARKVSVTDREVKDGDIVVIDFSGSIDGEKFDGGTAQNYELTIGSQTFIEGFEEQIIGMKIGETKNINVKFPDDYGAEHLKGKPAVFEVKLNEIFVKELPEADDKFAKDTSQFDALDEYKASIRDRILQARQRTAELEKENKLIEKIADSTQVDIPGVLVNDELDRIIEDLKFRLSYQGLSLEQYFKYLNTDEAQFRESKKADAQKTVKMRMTIEEIIKKENLGATQEELKAKFSEYAEKAKKTVDEYMETMSEQQYNYSYNDITMKKLQSFLKENNEFIEIEPKQKKQECDHCK
ncbi:MAG TPA: trigger factor [Clostridiales bacterium]|nr:trigger factor [Clostridiales bacterium]